LKRSIYSISGALGVNRLFTLLNRHRPGVLVFHGVTRDERSDFCNYQGKHLHLSIFAGLMEYVAEHFNAVPLARIVDWLETGRGLPDRALAVTFDDGYRNVLTDAAPVLKRLGIPATLFVVTDFVFERRMLWPDRLVSALSLTRLTGLRLSIGGETMDLPLTDRHEKIAADRLIRRHCKQLPDDERIRFIEDAIEQLGVEERQLVNAWDGHRAVEPDELRDLAGFGVEVGSHTRSHAIVAQLDSEKMRVELDGSKREIEAATGRACVEFSYPNGAVGDFDERTRAALVEAGYRCGVTTVKQRLVGGQDAYTIPRMMLTDNDVTLGEFAAEVSGFTSTLRRLRNVARPQ